MSKLITTKRNLLIFLIFYKITNIYRYVKKETVDQFLDQNYDYVCDCIDNVEAKIELISQCIKKNFKVISSCGAGMKCDPTRI